MEAGENRAGGERAKRLSRRLTVRSEVVTSTERLAEIVPAWERLCRRSTTTLFQSHAWISAWWAARDVTVGLRLQIGLCWGPDDELQAIIPCVTRRYRGLRVLEWAAKECSDYCDGIVDPSAADAMVTAWQAVLGAGGFSVVYLSHIRPDAALPGLLQDTRLSNPCLRLGHRTEQTLQVCKNGHTGASWFRTLSKKARNNHLRGKRIIEEVGAVTIGIVDPRDVTDTVDQMIRLKSKWLATHKQVNPLLDREARGLRAQIDVLARQHSLQVFAITCDGSFVAGLVNIVCDGWAAAFFSAFDEQYDRASPGTVVLVEFLLWAFDHGLPVVDFLCGDEGYKLKFANSRLGLASYVGARTMLGHAALASEEWMDRWRPRRAEVRAESRLLKESLAISN